MKKLIFVIPVFLFFFLSSCSNEKNEILSQPENIHIEAEKRSERDNQDRFDLLDDFSKEMEKEVSINGHESININFLNREIKKLSLRQPQSEAREFELLKFYQKNSDHFQLPDSISLRQVEKYISSRKEDLLLNREIKNSLICANERLLVFLNECEKDTTNLFEKNEKFCTLVSEESIMQKTADMVCNEHIREFMGSEEFILSYRTQMISNRVDDLTEIYR